MKKEEKVTAVIGLIVIIAILLTIIAVSAVFIVKRNNENKSAEAEAPGAEDPETAAAMYVYGLDTGENGERYALSTDSSRMYIDVQPQTECGKQLYSYLIDRWSGEVQLSSFDDASAQAIVPVNITCPSTELIADAVTERLQAVLEEKAAATTEKSSIYDENDAFLPNVLDEAYAQALDDVFNSGEYEISVVVGVEMKVSYSHKKWSVSNTAVPGDTLDERAAKIREAAEAALEYIPVISKIEEDATAAPAPDQLKFGATEDPAVVSALLETKEAKRLIGDETLVWNPDIEFISGKPIRYYLDESILMIQWSETEARAVGTFSEVFIADGSQLRRKIAGDTFGDMNFEYTTQFAKDTNAVLALGGDFYNHGRNCGIVVINRDIYRFDPNTCDVCYITTDGDMLFSYRNTFTEVEQAAKFIEENDVLFSLSFGPVLIDDGKDVTPSEYTWGEINDNYARSALGMLGRHHYLTMNINCELPHRYFLATLRQAADAMINRGCIKAYTLDGGQTATTAINGELCNPVQFDHEKAISDIIYFATAVKSD